MNFIFDGKVSKIDDLDRGVCIAFSYQDRTLLGITGVMGELSLRRKLLVALGPSLTDQQFPRVIDKLIPAIAIELCSAQLIPSVNLVHVHAGSTDTVSPGVVLVDEDAKMHIVAAAESGLYAINVNTGNMCHCSDVRIASWFSSWRIIREELGKFVEVLKFPQEPPSEQKPQ